MSKHITQSDRMTILPHKNAKVFRFIFIPFFHITDAERNITRKDRQSCYKKHRVQLLSDGIGITNKTTNTFITNLHDFT